MITTEPADLDAYIARFPEEVQMKLEQMRATIQKAAPGAEETIKYAMPTFVWNGNLVHFAAFKNHIGFYPAPTGIKAFEKELAGYKSAKGSVQFPLDKPLPLHLVAKIVTLRMQENAARAKPKKK